MPDEAAMFKGQTEELAFYQQALNKMMEMKAEF